MCVCAFLAAELQGAMGLGTRAGHGCVEYFRTCSACGKEADPGTGGLQVRRLRWKMSFVLPNTMRCARPA